MKIKVNDKIYILGTGNQAPYGINEIIDIIPAAHIRKVKGILTRYYNPPALRLNGKGGQKVIIEDGEYKSLPPY